jgi:uncharacterized protein with FMN-binding domain
MKRAILVSSSTVAGLVAVLTYSGADQLPAMAAGASDLSGGAAAGLGAPPAEEPAADPSTSDSAAPAASPSGSTSASQAAAPASSAPAAPTKAAAAPTKAAAVAPTKAAAAAPTPAAAAPKPTPTKAAAPKPAPVATPTGPKDYVGALITHKYGKVQVGIRVKGGKIIASWAAVFPTGNSQPYSDFAIPVLTSQTVKAQSAAIAGASGATLTTAAWKQSLASALSKAGL